MPVGLEQRGRRWVRGRLLWARARDSLWLIPGICVALALAAATVAVRLRLPETPEWGFAERLIFGGGAEGARVLLGAIAGSLITVTGVVFSVTIVALQLASTQFTPRVLRSFIADRTNQVVLGILIGTFTYTVLVLRTIREPVPDAPVTIPALAVTVAVALALVSIGAMVYFIHHAARSVQASVIVDREARHALAYVDEYLVPLTRGAGAGDAALPSTPPVAVLATHGGVVQAVDADALFALAEGRDLTVRMDVPVGSYVYGGEALASVWPADRVDAGVWRAVHDAFVLGHERTPEQDVEFFIIEISDVGTRALSSAINDPTTAMLAIDRLGEVVAAIGRCGMPQAVWRDAGGTPRFIARQTDFARVVGLAFDHIRHFGVGTPSVAKKLLDTLGRLAALVPPAHRPPLLAQVEATLHAARNTEDVPADLASIEEVGAEAVRRARMS